jgi:hypothetical protein
MNSREIANCYTDLGRGDCLCEEFEHPVLIISICPRCDAKFQPGD